MKKVSVEVYSYSEKSTKKYGLYRSIMDESFALLAVVYSIDNSESIVIDIESGQKLSEELIYALLRTDVMKCTYNSEVTRVILSRYLNIELPIDGWQSVVDMQTYVGIAPINNVYKVFAEEKDTNNETIMFFCRPSKTSYERNKMSDNPIKWKVFLEEIRKDFWDKNLLRQKLECYAMSKEYSDYVLLKQKIRLKGIKVKENALRKMVSKEHWETVELLTNICLNFGIDNTVRLNQIFSGTVPLVTLPEKLPCDIAQLRKYKNDLYFDTLFKYKKLYHRICPDGYIHGWSVEKYDIHELYQQYVICNTNIAGIRFPFLKIGVMAWLADEAWLIETLNERESMLDKLIKKNGLSKNDNIEALYSACMWCGGIWQLEKSCFATDKNIDEYNNYVVNWRVTNSKIVDFWGQIYRAFCYAIINKKDIVMKNITICFDKQNIIVKLPSGRKLLYMLPEIKVNKYGETEFTHVIFNKEKEYKRVKAKAGIICHAIVSNIVDDIIAFYVLLLDKHNIEVTEITNERVIIGFSDEEEISKIKLLISENKPSWAHDLPLNSEWITYMEVETKDEIRKSMDKRIG